MSTNADRALDALVAAAGDGPVDCDGLRLTTDDGSFAVETPDERADGLDEDGLRSVLADHPRFVDNWWTWSRLDGARRAFLRWVEGADQHGVSERYDALADGLRAEWGELSVRVALDETGRRYELRHAGDVGAAPSTLERLEDPLDLRRPLKFDDDDRYRPLKTAPNAPTGWLVDGLDGRALVEAVEVAYPATVENWHREREGALDVTHWREAAERQTGIYGVIEELPREAVDWVAEAACVDSQCLKRREWEYDEDDGLDADGGDGPFPCREPCSLVVAAARRWTTLEREEERSYEFTLTPSEKEQVEAVIDAVADDTADEIREADVYEGANRYRARYLRAKRVDDDGNLCGVETEPDSDSDSSDHDD